MRIASGSCLLLALSPLIDPGFDAALPEATGGGMAGGGRRRLRPHISSVPGGPVLKLPFTPPFNPYHHLARKVVLFLVYRWENRLTDTVTRAKSNRGGRAGISEPV